MAEAKKKAGAANRFGVRYGRTTREKISNIEREQRKRQVCPYCTKSQVRRVAAGIWHCNACNAKFTGAAYVVKHESKAETEEQHG